MKRKRYSVEQIVAAVKQHELGTPAADIARKLGIAEQTFYRWKKQCGGLEASEVRELRQLREENAKLKKPVADLSLDKVTLQDLASKGFHTDQAWRVLCDKLSELLTREFVLDQGLAGPVSADHMKNVLADIDA
jgi:putative transposase